VVDAVFLAEDEALPLAGLGQQMAPGDVLVLVALEAVVGDVAGDLVVEAPDQPVTQGQAREQGEIALGHAEGHVGAVGVAPFGDLLAALVDDARGAAARRHRSQHFVVGSALAGIVGHHELPVGHVHAGRPMGFGGPGEGDRVFQVVHARNQHWRPPRSKRRKHAWPLRIR